MKLKSFSSRKEVNDADKVLVHRSEVQLKKIFQTTFMIQSRKGITGRLRQGLRKRVSIRKDAVLLDLDEFYLP